MIFRFLDVVHTVHVYSQRCILSICQMNISGYFYSLIRNFNFLRTLVFRIKSNSFFITPASFLLGVLLLFWVNKKDMLADVITRDRLVIKGPGGICIIFSKRFIRHFFDTHALIIPFLTPLKPIVDS